MKKTIELLALALIMSQTALTKAVYDGSGKLEISGPSNTLASIARDLNDPNLFSYEADKRTALCRIATVTVVRGGTLTLGNKAEPGQGETLIFDCRTTPGAADQLKDKDKYILKVAMEGTLNLYHSQIDAANSFINPTAMRFAGIEYEAYARGEVLQSGLRNATRLFIGSYAEVTIAGFESRKCLYGINLHGVQKGGTISGVKAVDCYIGVFLRLQMADDSPGARLADCALDGSRAAIVCCRIDDKRLPLFVTLEDCDLPQAREKRVMVQDNQTENMGLVIAHRVKFRLTDAAKKPIAGEQISIISSVPGAPPLAPEVVLTDSDGQAWATAPEYIDYYSAGAKAGWEHLECFSRITAGDTVIKDKWAPTNKCAFIFEKNAAGKFIEKEDQFTEGKSLILVNLIQNSSFEITAVPGVPDCWFPRPWIQTETNGLGITRHGGPLVFLGLDTQNPYHGKNCLRLGPESGAIRQKPFLQTPGGKTYTYSAYMRADVPDTEAVISFQHSTGVPPWKFKLTREWKRYSFTVFMEKNFGLLFFNNGPGDAFIDAIQLEEGNELHPYVKDNYKPWVY